ncbi:MAG: hypothetical protein IKW02_01230 [Clostridia bacterium]|nr:hypothetical protein [Clostridia bacterium]
MTAKKNFFQAETKEQAKKIISRMMSAGFLPRSGLDRLIEMTSYPCRFYNNTADEIIIDYTPGGGWGTFADFRKSWMERPNRRKKYVKR